MTAPLRAGWIGVRGSFGLLGLIGILGACLPAMLHAANVPGEPLGEVSGKLQAADVPGEPAADAPSRTADEVSGELRVRVSGEVAAEARLYLQRPAYANQDPERLRPSIRLEPRLTAVLPDLGNARLSLQPRLRWDAERDDTELDWLEAHLLWVGSQWDFVAGIDRRSWAVTEARNPVDILNQIDWVDGPDSDSRLGQPMLNLNLLHADGQLALFVLPRFVPRNFGPPGTRLQGPFGIDDHERYAASRGRDHVDYAARYQHILGPIDIGISHFRGTRREPRFVPRAGETAGTARLTPYYEQITQWGLDLQALSGSWHWKLEAITQDGELGRYQALAAGLEYTWPGLGGGRIDLGLLAEYLYDGDPGTLPAPIFDDDLFAGLRLVFNDAADSQVLLGAVVDRNNRSTVFGIEAQRRLGSQWRIALDGRIPTNIAPADPLEFIARDRYLHLQLGYFF